MPEVLFDPKGLLYSYKEQNPSNKKTSRQRPMLQRSIEIGMRASSGIPTPKEVVSNYIQEAATRGFTPIPKDILYVTTGLGQPSIQTYNGLYVNGADLIDKADSLGVAYDSPEIEALVKESDKKPDLIDGLLYGKKIHPAIGKQIDPSKESYGLEQNYIDTNFPGQKPQYIETEPYGINIPN